jgi:nucleoside-triphosphatase THEP1
MNDKTRLNEKWLKSSVIGTVWASSEIVLGSFLHNLKVPFSGSILTAIGVVILISAAYLWKEKGIFWRAGLICALMKTLSPSAVIFGPMIAIFTESLLLEASVRIFGRNYIGFITGSVLAVSWGFAQKIFNFLIFYGFNIVELYKSLMQYAERQLNLQFNSLWVPILIMLSVYILIGIVAAITGIRTGKKLVSQPLEFKPKKYANPFFFNHTNSNKKFRYSLVWLAINFLLIATGLLLISLASWEVWIVSVPAISAVWIARYKRALRQLSKPKFWIFFVFITMLTAFLFTKMQGLTVFQALLTGLEMNFRATVLILGFSVIGTELYNPKIRNFFSKTYFKQLPVALELSAESLPQVIANIPDFKTIVKNPVSVVYQLIAYSEFRLSQIKKEQNFRQQIFVVKGKIDSGKTTVIKELIENLKRKNIQIGGIYTQKVFENEERVGYDVVDAKTNTAKTFLRIDHCETCEKIGIFSIFPDGVKRGEESLHLEKTTDDQLVVIDEVGMLELNGKGWANRLDHLIKSGRNHLLIAVRDEFSEEVLKKWNILHATVFEAPVKVSAIEKEILEKISQRN